MATLHRSPLVKLTSITLKARWVSAEQNEKTFFLSRCSSGPKLPWDCRAQVAPHSALEHITWFVSPRPQLSLQEGSTKAMHSVPSFVTQIEKIEGKPFFFLFLLSLCLSLWCSPLFCSSPAASFEHLVYLYLPGWKIRSFLMLAPSHLLNHPGIHPGLPPLFPSLSRPARRSASSSSRASPFWPVESSLSGSPWLWFWFSRRVTSASNRWDVLHFLRLPLPGHSSPRLHLP